MYYVTILCAPGNQMFRIVRFSSTFCLSYDDICYVINEWEPGCRFEVLSVFKLNEEDDKILKLPVINHFDMPIIKK